MIIRLLVLIGLVLSPLAPIISSVVQPAIASAPPPASAMADSSASLAEAHSALQSSPVMFIENVGQFDDGARFQVRGGDHTIWLAEDALWITVVESPADNQPSADRLVDIGNFPIHDPQSEIENRKGVNIKLSFVGANPHPRVEPLNRVETHVSYFIGSDADQWHADVPVWRGIRYVDLYPGIDLEIVGENGRASQRIVARSGADRARFDYV